MHLDNLGTSPEFLTLLLENSKEGILALDMNFNFIFRNRRALQLHGIPEDVDVKRWPEYMSVFDLEGLNEIPYDQLPAVRAIKNGEVVHDEFLLIKRKNFPPVLVKYSAHPIYDENNIQIGAILTCEDRDDLAHSMARFKALFDQSPLSIQILNPQGKTVLINKAFQRLWGLKDDFVKNFLLKDYNIHEDELLIKNGGIDFIRRAFAGEEVTTDEVYFDPNESGFEGAKPRWTIGHIYPLKNSLGQVTEVVIVHQDITEDKRTKSNKDFLERVKSVLLSTIDYDKIMDHISSIAIPYIADGCTIDILEDGSIKRIISKHSSPETLKLTIELIEKFPLSLNSCRPPCIVIATGKAELMNFTDPDVLRSRTTSDEHFKCVQKIGLRSNMAIPLEVRGKILGVINLFITTDRPLFDEIDFEVAKNFTRFASLALENAMLYQKAHSGLQLRDEFISIASHELRTPITSLNLQVDVLNSIVDEMDGTSDHPRMMKKFLTSTNNQLKRLTRLVDDMLDISRISSGKMSLNIKKTNFTNLTMDVLDRFSDQLREMNIEINFFGEENIFADCDPDRMDQVITNFMTNAIRYGRKKPIHVSLFETGQNVVIKIKDHGRGISKDDHKRIFKRFERAHTEEDVSGLGLGLFINQQIIDEHFGSIAVESEPDVGSTFIVEIPIIKD